MFICYNYYYHKKKRLNMMLRITLSLLLFVSISTIVNTANNNDKCVDIKTYNTFPVVWFIKLIFQILIRGLFCKYSVWWTICNIHLWITRICHLIWMSFHMEMMIQWWPMPLLQKLRLYRGFTLVSFSNIFRPLR